MQLNLSHIGKAIKIIRLEKDMKQNDFSNRTGMSAGFICQIESGKRTPTVEKIIVIANALDVPASQIFLKAESYAQLQTQ